MKQQKTNGVANLDEQTEKMRLQVVQLELRARYWKANYEIKQYMLSDKELKADYEAYLQEILEEEKKAMDDLKKQMETNVQKGITAEPVLEGETENEPQEQTQQEV